jgi:polysaccharide deacetylase family protein (PEP-CTERM system associated)
MEKGESAMSFARHEKCLFTVDVEDWFHIPGSPKGQNVAEWRALPSHVSKNFHAMLQTFAEKNVRVTCFFLGWVAEQFPELVRVAWNQGHEIACHGYSHGLVYQMTPEEFLADIRKAKHIIEDITGAPVLGYRAPCFSVTEDTPWFFDKLLEAGYRFDSSVFPASRRFGGLKTSNWNPGTVDTAYGQVAEFPITVIRALGRPVCFFGGGYLRLFPYPLIRRMGMRVLQEGRPIIFYVHPREIDPDHPRMAMSPVARFKSYVNLHTTRTKIEKILDDFSFTTFADMIAANKFTERIDAGFQGLAIL